jgi:hypothetical protein
MARLALLALEERDVPSTVQGVVFNDLNGNGVQDPGEPGLQGWTVYTDPNQNDIIDAGDLTTTTDANGHYLMDTSTMPSYGFYTNLDLQVSDGTGRWVNTTALSVVTSNESPPIADEVRNFGVHFQPYGSVTPVGAESLVNVNTTGTQNGGSVSADANGDYVVTWATGSTVLARVFNSDGTARTGEITVTATGGTPLVAMAGNGNFLVVWTSNSSAYGRLYQADGTALTGQITVAASNSRTTVFAAGVAADTAGDFVVVNRATTTSRTSTTQTNTAQRITPSGSLNGSAINVANFSLLNGVTSVAMDGTGNFVVVWDDVVTTKFGKNTTSNSDVFAQRYTALGAANGGRITVVSGDTTGSGIVWQSSVAMNATGTFAVAWHVGTSGANTNVVKVFNANGSVALGPVVFAPSFAADAVSRLAIDSAGNSTFTWTANGCETNDVWMARLLADGTLEAPTIVNTTTQGSQQTGGESGGVSGGIAATGINSFVVTWQGFGAGDDQGIFSQRFGAPTAGPMARLSPVTQPPPGQSAPAVGTGGLTGGPVTQATISHSRTSWMAFLEELDISYSTHEVSIEGGLAIDLKNAPIRLPTDIDWSGLADRMLGSEMLFLGGTHITS